MDTGSTSPTESAPRMTNRQSNATAGGFEGGETVGC